MNLLLRHEWRSEFYYKGNYGRRINQKPHSLTLLARSALSNCLPAPFLKSWAEYANSLLDSFSSPRIAVRLTVLFCKSNGTLLTPNGAWVVAEEIPPPFSARNRGAHSQIDNDCPESTRIGLLHLLHGLVERDYIRRWSAIAAELQRISRFKPDSAALTQEYAEMLLLALDWDKVFDFCERIYNNLVQDVYAYDSTGEPRELLVHRNVAQEYVATELRTLFLEENLALEFTDGAVRRRGRRHTAQQIARAELVLGDPRLSKAAEHYKKALKYFRNVSQPDYENVVKEAVCAVEATARKLFPSGGSTLGKVVESITGNGFAQLPKPIALTFNGLYGFRNSGEGVGHGGTTGGPVTKELAEYSLALAASQIVLLVDLEIAESEVPF